MATTVAATPIGTSTPVSFRNNIPRIRVSVANIRSNRNFPPASLRNGSSFVLACLPYPPPASQSPTPSSNTKFTSSPSTKLYVTGISFRTTEESLRNAFKKFGELVEVNLVMDKIANRPRGFAFLRYATEEDSQKAIEGMHGKFLDGRVIFVEVAKPRSELRRRLDQNPR
ncbi:organelle RRM domain-containing protein 6, chloroplastic [Neltuma alba]|uniref:organelle RRM domain-containing protein 6, chloroplastic n=1 Tax=Neltuma alba TaxID=207710 RepID=UPI0010A47FE4|nr:organelle RRM domain-containing protein 6, chloroplastic-like [Prosopis alba]